MANTGPTDIDNGWVGQHQRPSEHQIELKPTIEMGARPYRADLGRFLRVDPIPGGATDSNYAYVPDPINTYDLNGKCGTFGNPFKKCKKGRKGNSGFLGGLFSKSVRAVYAVNGAVVRKATNVAGWFEAGGVSQRDSWRCAPGVKCYDNFPAVPGTADAFTIGSRIFCRKKCEGDLLQHELVHVAQIRADGFFAVKYIINSIGNGTGCSNSYEVAAYEKNWPCPHGA